MVLSQILITLLLAACRSATLTADNDIENNMMLLSVEQHLAPNGYEFEMMDLLGLGNRPARMKRHPSLRHSASKFLLEVYHEISEEETKDEHATRHRRALHENSIITTTDRKEIEKCNNIITFSGRTPQINPQKAMIINFNTNDVPRDLQLVHSALRIYQDPQLGGQRNQRPYNVTISLHYQIYNRQQHATEFRILTSVNSTTAFCGWHEFNVTSLIGRWLQHRTLQQINYGGDILIRVTTEELPADRGLTLDANDIGLVHASDVINDMQLDQQPFIIGYFNGPELMAKIQTLRFKRDVVKRKRRAGFQMRPPPPSIPEIYKMPKTCERLNFTLDFKDLHMHNWVIAPKKFEAYFCGGECNFPLGSKMNATNHAIVQTLMHLKQPNLPKPCCVPTVLGSISLLHYLNEDSVNLSKYPQSVAKECGCH